MQQAGTCGADLRPHLSQRLFGSARGAPLVRLGEHRCGQGLHPLGEARKHIRHPEGAGKHTQSVHIPHPDFGVNPAASLEAVKDAWSTRRGRLTQEMGWMDSRELWRQTRVALKLLGKPYLQFRTGLTVRLAKAKKIR